MPAPAPAAGADPNNPGTGFDAEAFTKTLMSQIDAKLNGFAANQKKDLEKFEQKIEALKPPSPEPKPEDTPPPEAKTIAELNLRAQQSDKKIATLEQRLEAADKATNEAKAQAAEQNRVASFKTAIAEIPFASAKARQQFTDAYLGKVKYADDGSLVVDTDQGPAPFDVYLQNEAENSPYLLAPQGGGGSGASAGKKPGGGLNSILAMSQGDISKMPPAERSAALSELTASLVSGS